MTTIIVEEQSQVIEETSRFLRKYGRKRGNLIPFLLKVQGKLGYLPWEDMLEIPDILNIP
jgi:NADH:ubiquinone oxidoreductase subunit E